MAAHLSIEWPAPQSTSDQKRDAYYWKLLGHPPDQRKPILFPILSEYTEHMKHYWGNPLNLKHGVTGLNVKDMPALDIGDHPVVQPSIARHLTLVAGLAIQN